jgi:aminoglycoside phosphotransferase (APT) family kinase protein
LSERDEPSPQALDWVARVTGCTVDAAQPLAGGRTTEVYSITAGDAEYVLKRFSDHAWFAKEPDVAAREASHLRLLESSAIAAPRLVAVDEDGAASGEPSLLMTRVPGQVLLEPYDVDAWLRSMAEQLTRIHAVQVTADDVPWTYYRWVPDEHLVVPQWTEESAAWRAALDRLAGTPPRFEERFIHRDYHPTNILWTDDNITGIVDWASSCRGPVGVDVGHCRLNLAALHGVDVAERFRAAWEAASGQAQDPYWDLDTVVAFLPEPDMYQGWRDLGVPEIALSDLRQRHDAYIVSIVARL